MSDTKVITGKIRFSYAHLFKPSAVSDGDEPKYSVSILIDKNDAVTLKKINRAVEAAKQQGKAEKFGGKIPANLKLPLRDGDIDRPEDEAYEGMYFINCSSKRKPEVIDRDRNEVFDASECASGDYGRVSINFYPFASKGNKGVACGLNNVQVLEKGESLAGTVASAADDFADEYEDDLV